MLWYAKDYVNKFFVCICNAKTKQIGKQYFLYLSVFVCNKAKFMSLIKKMFPLLFDIRSQQYVINFLSTINIIKFTRNYPRMLLEHLSLVFWCVWTYKLNEAKYWCLINVHFFVMTEQSICVAFQPPMCTQDRIMGKG